VAAQRVPNHGRFLRLAVEAGVHNDVRGVEGVGPQHAVPLQEHALLFVRDDEVEARVLAGGDLALDGLDGVVGARRRERVRDEQAAGALAVEVDAAVRHGHEHAVLVHAEPRPARVLVSRHQHRGIVAPDRGRRRRPPDCLVAVRRDHERRVVVVLPRECQRTHAPR